MKKCLDKGYVRLVNVMGSDLTIANAARVSYDKQSFEMSDKDERLIKFLAEGGHSSPFRHASLQFEVYAPLMVARQWWKYIVGSDHTMDAWNESSRRYITEEPAFYVPDEWRYAAANSKQGSGEAISGEAGVRYTAALNQVIEDATRLYDVAIQDGICPEQARLFLPAYGLYVRWYWTTSLQAALHLIQQRLAHDAQREFQVYAEAVHEYVREAFPVSTRHILEG